MAVRERDLQSNLSVAGCYAFLSEADKKQVLRCATMEEAVQMVKDLYDKVPVPTGRYVPKTGISGNTRRYREKAKEVFTDNFDEKDVDSFTNLFAQAATMEKEVLAGEVKRKCSAIERAGNQPLQCMIYATKVAEKTIFADEAKTDALAGVIAQLVNEAPAYLDSLNHMLVNWEWWRSQIWLLIKACSLIQESESLDAVIRDLYADSEDERICFAIYKRMLASNSIENYTCAFNMLKKRSFLQTSGDKEYWYLLQGNVKRATPEKKEMLYSAFSNVSWTDKKKKDRIEALFVSEVEERPFVKSINEAASDTEKEEVLGMIRERVFGSMQEVRDLYMQHKRIKNFRPQIQAMFKEKYLRGGLRNADLKDCCLGIIDFDDDNSAIAFFQKSLDAMREEQGKDDVVLTVAYAMAVRDSAYIPQYLNRVLEYYGRGGDRQIMAVRDLLVRDKMDVVRDNLYLELERMEAKYGIASQDMVHVFSNLASYLDKGNSSFVYRPEIDEVIFRFLGYDKEAHTFDPGLCTPVRAFKAWDVVENFMTPMNYERQYSAFIMALYNRFRIKQKDFARRIEEKVEQITHEGILSV